MNKRNIPSIVLYVVAGLTAVYAIWSTIYGVGVISEAVSAGQITIIDNFYDIISFYMSSCAQYYAFAFLLAAAGLILYKNLPAAKITKIKKTPAFADQSGENDGEIDEWFEETETENAEDNSQ